MSATAENSALLKGPARQGLTGRAGGDGLAVTSSHDHDTTSPRVVNPRQEIFLDNLPAALRELDIWVLWCLEPNEDGKITKVPYQARGERRKAKSNDPTTWAKFDRAVKYWQAHEWVTGLGICFTGRLCGVDLDHCVIAGEIQPWAQQVIAELDSYTEFSQSGTGVHILTWGDLPDGRRKVDLPELGQGAAIEMYGAGSPRFFVVTGKVINE